MGTLTEEQKRAIMGGQGLQESQSEANSEEKEEKEEQGTEAKESETQEQKSEDVQKKEKQSQDAPKEFDYSIFNEKFGKQIDNEESLKALFDKADKYEGEYQDTLQKLNEYKSIADKVDPLSHFASEDEYKRQQLLMKSNDLGEQVVDALSRLTPSKVEKLSDAEALKLNLMVDKGLAEKEAETYLLNKYGIEDFTDEDIEDGVKTTIKVDAIDARRSVSKLYDGIELPTKTDYETARTQLQESWKEPIPALLKGIDKIQIADGIDFVVTDSMKEGLDSALLSRVMASQTKPSEEALGEMAGMVRDQIVINNLDKVVKSAIADAEEKWKEGNRKEIHNDKPLKDDSRAEKGEEDNDSKMKRML